MNATLIFSDETHLLKQFVSCQNILTKVQEIAENSKVMEPETWNVLLEFLLAVNNTILSVPRDAKENGKNCFMLVFRH